MKKYLFVCSANRDRSLTAEVLFSLVEGIECLSCGINKDAETRISPDLLEWADIIFVMESKHKQKMESQYNKIVSKKRIVVLGIPDTYFYMDKQLAEILKRKTRIYFN